MLLEAGLTVSTTEVDVSSRESVRALVDTATALGDVVSVIHAVGVSPSQASPEMILRVDLYGTALVLEELGAVIAAGGAGVVIASQSGHRLPALTPEQDEARAIADDQLCPAGRAATPDEVGTVDALLPGADGAFITGSDILTDGGVTASYRFGDLRPS